MDYDWTKFSTDDNIAYMKERLRINILQARGVYIQMNDKLFPRNEIITPTADCTCGSHAAPAQSTSRLTDAERADVLRRSHAVADAAAAPTTAARMNARNREVWSRTTPGGQPRPTALPPGFTPSGGM